MWFFNTCTTSKKFSKWFYFLWLFVGSVLNIALGPLMNNIPNLPILLIQTSNCFIDLIILMNYITTVIKTESGAIDFPWILVAILLLQLSFYIWIFFLHGWVNVGLWSTLNLWNVSGTKSIYGLTKLCYGSLTLVHLSYKTF